MNSNVCKITATFPVQNPLTQPQVKKQLHQISELKVQDEGFPGFLNHFVQKVFEKQLRVDTEDRILKLDYHLFGNHLSPKSLYYRDVYKTLHPIVLEKLNSYNGAQVLLAGTSGCGKSAFGLIILMKLLQNNEVVLYSTRSARFLIIPKEPKERHVEMLRVCYRELDYEVSQIKPGISEFKFAGDRDLFELLIRKDLYHILDLGEDSTSIIPMFNTGRTLIISSPNSDRLGKLHSATSMLKLFLPTWREDEVLEANELIFKLDEKDVKEAFNILGGVARIIFEKNSLDERFEELNIQLGGLTMEKLQNILRSSAYENLPNSKDTYLLIHVGPKDGGFSRWETRFATEYVSRCLMERFLRDNQFQAQNLIAQVSGIAQCAAWRGYMIESLVHHSLTNTKNKLIPATTWCILYQDTESSGCFKSFKGMPFASFKIFSSLEEISYKPDTYYQPRSKIFKTVDSFVSMTRKTLETWFPELQLNRKQGEEEELYLVFFQSTVSSNHIVDGRQLNLIRKAIRERGVKLSNSQYLVFLTVENGIKKYQPVTYQSSASKKQDEEEEKVVGEEMEVEEVVVDTAGKRTKRRTKVTKYSNQASFGVQISLFMDSIFEAILKSWELD